MRLTDSSLAENADNFFNLTNKINYSKKLTKPIGKKLKKLLALVIVLAVVTVSAYQYFKFHYPVTHRVDLPGAFVRFIARDICLDPAHTGLLIKSLDARTYLIELGNWSVGTNRSYRAAFAIVNEEMFPINITKVAVINVTRPEGETTFWLSDFLMIYLHAHPRYWCNSALAKGDLVETEENKTLMWNRTAGATDNYWTLASGDADGTTYSNSTGYSWSSPWNSTYNVWLWYYAEPGVAALNGTADYVWVCIDILVPTTALNGTYSGMLMFRFEAEGVV